MPRRRLLTLNALLLLGLLGACVSWRAEPVAPAEFLSSHPKSVRLVRADGSRLIIFEPRVQGDSIVGTGSSRTQHLAMALADIRVVESSHTNVAGSIGVGLGVALLLAGIFFVVVVIPAFGQGYN